MLHVCFSEIYEMNVGHPCHIIINCSLHCRCYCYSACSFLSGIFKIKWKTLWNIQKKNEKEHQDWCWLQFSICMYLSFLNYVSNQQMLTFDFLKKATHYLYFFSCHHKMITFQFHFPCGPAGQHRLRCKAARGRQKSNSWLRQVISNFLTFLPQRRVLGNL